MEYLKRLVIACADICYPDTHHGCARMTGGIENRRYLRLSAMGPVEVVVQGGAPQISYLASIGPSPSRRSVRPSALQPNTAAPVPDSTITPVSSPAITSAGYSSVIP